MPKSPATAVPALLTLCLLLSSARAGSAESPMRPGLWQITTQMEMPGMPVQMQPHTSKVCFTKKDIDEGRMHNAKDSGCEMKDFKRQGNKATWRMACNRPEGTMEGAGSVSYSGDSFSGSATFRMSAQGRTMEMRQSLSGQRVGDCPK